MKKHFFSLSLILGLVFGMACFTSCSDDKDANEQASENRIEFLEHCRANLKDLAENLNFSSWVGINHLNNDFNTNVLNNPAFEKTISNLFIQQISQSAKAVEEGSELAQMGFQNYAVIDLTSFNYRFTQNADNTAFDVTPAEDFQLVYKRTQPKGPDPEDPNNPGNPGNPPPSGEGPQGDEYECLLLRASDTYSDMVAKRFSTPQLAVVVRIPKTFEFQLGKLKDDGSIDALVSGSFKNEYFSKSGSSYIDISTDSWRVSGTLQSNVHAPEAPDGVQGPDRGPKNDNTALNFYVFSDKVNQKGDVALNWEHNGRKMIDMTLKESGDGSGGIYNVDLSQLSSGSIFDVIASVFSGRSLDECKLTFLDDLTTTFSISDIQEATKLSQGVARARRNYADEATIDQFTQQFNEIMKFQITCKGINQTYPMKLITTKFGVDWWTMPAFRFAEGSDYVPVTDALDQESIRYMINIADHAVEPMQQSLVTVRQLMQYIQTLVGGLQNQQNQQNQQGS